LENLSFFLEAVVGLGFLYELKLRFIHLSLVLYFVLPVKRFKKLMMTGGEDESSEHVPLWMFLYSFLLSLLWLDNSNSHFDRLINFVDTKARAGQRLELEWLKGRAVGLLATD